MRKFLLMMLALTLLSLPAFGFEYKLGYDFGNPFDENNNWSPITYPGGVGNLPSPGLLSEGGEKFDLEGLHFAISGNTVHIALVNSFGTSAYSTSWRQSYNLGDIFFGINGSSTSYAIDVFTGQLYAVNTYSGIYNLRGSYYNNTAIRNAVGAYDVTSGTVLGNVNREYTMWQGLETNPMQGDGDTWVLEFSFDKSLLNLDGAQTINFHNTLGCGNDVMNKSFAVVPEPTSMMLFGLGMLGLGALRKRF
ncbi:MAG: PEP-CTERM sorting domain-containing protein [bacterium]|jgi:hypothetical protein